MSAEMIGVLGIVLLFVLLAFRMHIGLAMTLIGFGGVSLIVNVKAGLNLLGMVPWAEGSSYSLSVIPLFILMGQFAFISGISQDIYKAVYSWMGHLRGGLAMATIVACSGFAAVCGSSLATGATMAKVAIPEMQKYGYDPRLATGCVAAGGTLGILIPPSIGFIIYGILTEESIGKLFMAGIIPGLLLASLFLFAIILQCHFSPGMGPKGEPTTWKTKLNSLYDTWPMLSLFFLVMGGIYFGFFTPTEAAGIGAFGAFVITFIKKKINLTTLTESLLVTGNMTAMIFLIIIGATIFSSFLALTGIPFMLAETVAALALPRMVVLILMLLIFIALGCVMDCFAIMILMVPILFPIIQVMQFNPIWFGVIMVIVLEVGLITPPVGLNVFVIKGVVPSISITTMFQGVWPFLVAAVVCIAAIIIFPQIALFIPSNM
ncbi:TRAP transporter large permease [Desulfopila aestuarii]|uniref:TRAP transporter, DctM subunit n=1 Tax=Desulfopila aestuarii DSM 18488 TaxID=1121416 RepID=A0A1M7XYG1_9BACT|nr:TRAP transporter large permease [Desulfopila aestuarii]SHO44087.1 TRAP transporter, DctM subunit [Desulfopila aestuarii DSM 18488]